ncbi:RAC serine/threonine-protein kinase isoform X2 [Procambarus clarkii]|uniref:RAC serine/threonine-protein kinase isoform X2 n=1 Tax=Procambarus clarkii TaxID=6728 RepID=UPI0037431725
MSETGAVPLSPVVKEGWLNKRGEYIKNWRQRYFFLLEDGTFLGFKTKPKSGLDDPLNKFTVKQCQILKTETPRSNTFIIRGLHWRAVIERSFNAESSCDRDAWIEAIKHVSEKISASYDNHDLIQEVEALEKSQLTTYDEDGNSKGSRTSKKTKKVTLENFEFIKVLGRGTFGKVILCREKKSYQTYAMKILRKDVIVKRDEVAHTRTENFVLKAVDHPFLTYLKYSFQTNDHLCFVMEYVSGGELFFHLNEAHTFPEERARFYGAEICLAIGYLHERKIIYRDLKILLGDEYGRGVDWWGYGACLYEMMIGCLPFYDKDYDKLFHLITYEEVRFPKTISQEAHDLLEGLLQKNPYTRLGGGPGDVREIQDHLFYADIDWNLMTEKKVTPPFKPQVTSETDTRNFNQEFTGESVQLTPPDQEDYVCLTEEDSQYMTFNKFSYQDVSSTLGSSPALSLNSLNVAEKEELTSR